MIRSARVGRCLVLQPYRGSDDDLYEAVIRPTVEEQMQAVQLKDASGSDTEGLLELFDAVSYSTTIVADITQLNANVMYEIGYAHARGLRPLLFTLDASQVRSLPIYLRTLNVHAVSAGRVAVADPPAPPRRQGRAGAIQCSRHDDHPPSIYGHTHKVLVCQSNPISDLGRQGVSSSRSATIMTVLGGWWCASADVRIVCLVESGATVCDRDESQQSWRSRRQRQHRQPGPFPLEGSAARKPQLELSHGRPAAVAAW